MAVYQVFFSSALEIARRLFENFLKIIR